MSLKANYCLTNKIQVGSELIDLLEPDLSKIGITEIAFSLASIPHWNGHTGIGGGYLSVAAHSIIVAELCSDKLTGLMHDSPEFLIGDISRPLKCTINEQTNILVNIEQGVTIALAERFGFQVPFPQDVFVMDNVVLELERQVLLPKCNVEWSFNINIEKHLDNDRIEFVKERILQWRHNTITTTIDYIAELFITHFKQYGGKE